MVKEEFWQKLQREAQEIVVSEPLLASYVHACILNHRNFDAALSFILSNKMADDVMPALAIREFFDDAFADEPEMVHSALADLEAVISRDPAVDSYITVLSNFKGYLSIQVHRLAHYLWLKGRKPLSLFIQSRNSEVFAVDIHPAALIGKGVMFDHATGL